MFTLFLTVCFVLYMLCNIFKVLSCTRVCYMYKCMLRTYIFYIHMHICICNMHTVFFIHIYLYIYEIQKIKEKMYSSSKQCVPICTMTCFSWWRTPLYKQYNTWLIFCQFSLINNGIT